MKLLKEKLLPMCNLFGYCQVASAYGSGNFINVLHEKFPDRDSHGDSVDSGLITSRINGRDDIMGSLRTLFKPGR